MGKAEVENQFWFQDFLVTYELKGYMVEFVVYEKKATEIDDNEQPICPLFESSTGEFTQSWKAARPFAKGNVDREGCSNWSFPDAEDGVPLHFCDKDDISGLSNMLAACLDVATACFDKQGVGDG